MCVRTGAAMRAICARARARSPTLPVPPFHACSQEMGLGKTVQTIALFCYLMERKGNPGPYLVTVPLSTLSNWANEFARWAPTMTVVQYKGNPVQRKEVWKRQLARAPFNVVLTTYDYVMKDKSTLRKIYWQYIVIDEGHRLKNAQCKFTQILGTEYNSRNRLLLTGTPLQNSLPELWSLLNFLLPQVFHSVDNFEEWFSKPFASFRSRGSGAGVSQAAQAAAAEATAAAAALTKEESMLVINRLHQVLRPFLLRRVKSQVLSQLPEKVERVVRCELSAWQRLQYRQIQRFGCVAHDPAALSGGGPRLGLSNIVMQLRKCVNHPYLFVDSYDIDDDLWRASGKLELLDRVLGKLKAGGHRVLIFNQMTAVMDLLDDFFAYRGHAALRLDGSTSAADREERMRAFNAPDSPYFIFSLSTRAGGLGINLATADTVVLFDSDWNPTADAQAQDRAHRIGQTREVRVLRLCSASPIEEMVLARAGDKASMEALVIDAGQFSTADGAASTSAGAGGGSGRKRALEDLIAAELAHAGDAADAGVPSEAELNELLARDDAELALFNDMDAARAREEHPRYAGNSLDDDAGEALGAFLNAKQRADIARDAAGGKRRGRGRPAATSTTWTP